MIWDGFSGFSGLPPQIYMRHSMKIKVGAICCTLRGAQTIRAITNTQTSYL